MSKSLRLPQIKAMCETDICIVTYVKRTTNEKRRMLCTASRPFLNSMRARLTFQWRKPMGKLPYNANQKKLVTVFDLVMMGWRHLNVDEGLILERNFGPEDEYKEFWSWFEKEMYPMSTNKKLKWMGKK